MIGRISTWIFYAIVFFMLGAWSNSHWSGIGNLVDQGLAAGRSGAASAWAWMQGTGSPKEPESKDAPKEIAKAEPAPAAPAAEPAAPAAEPAAPAAEPEVSSLNTARDAFARGDVNGAVAAYKEYLAAHPEDFDALGELGNVFFNAGRIDEAAQAYYDAANLLLAAGDKQRAQALEGAIRLGNPGLADDLAQKLARA